MSNDPSNSDAVRALMPLPPPAQIINLKKLRLWLQAVLGLERPPSPARVRKWRAEGMPYLPIGQKTIVFEATKVWQWFLGLEQARVARSGRVGGAKGKWK